MIFKKKAIKNEAQALLEMYKAGYYDGFTACYEKKTTWNKLKTRCKVAFDKRFMIKHGKKDTKTSH